MFGVWPAFSINWKCWQTWKYFHVYREILATPKIFRNHFPSFVVGYKNQKKKNTSQAPLTPPSTMPKNQPHHWVRTDNDWIGLPTTSSTIATFLGLLFYLSHWTHATMMRPTHACDDWIVDDTAFSPIDMFFSLYFSCDRQSGVLFFLFLHV